MLNGGWLPWQEYLPLLPCSRKVYSERSCPCLSLRPMPVWTGESGRGDGPGMSALPSSPFSSSVRPGLSLRVFVRGKHSSKRSCLVALWGSGDSFTQHSQLTAPRLGGPDWWHLSSSCRSVCFRGRVGC